MIGRRVTDSRRHIIGEVVKCVYDHHGWANGDNYPLTLTLEEVQARYTRNEV